MECEQNKRRRVPGCADVASGAGSSGGVGSSSGAGSSVGGSDSIGDSQQDSILDNRATRRALSQMKTDRAVAEAAGVAAPGPPRNTPNAGYGPPARHMRVHPHRQSSAMIDRALGVREWDMEECAVGVGCVPWPGPCERACHLCVRCLKSACELCISLCERDVRDDATRPGCRALCVECAVIVARDALGDSARDFVPSRARDE